MRLIRDLVTGVLTIAIGISVIGATPALAKASCLQTAPQADVTLTQSLSSSGGTSYVDSATLVNLGPCNVPDVALQLTLPAGSVVGTVTSNPSSWACTASAPGPNPTMVTCAPQATMGVPGTAVINVSFTTGVTNPTVIGQAIVGGGTGATWCVTPSTPTTSTCDPNTDNNLSYAAFVPVGGGSLTNCPAQFCDQYTSVNVGASPNGGGVQIQQLKQQCPKGFPNCFGQLVSISTSISGALWHKTFTIKAPANLGFGKVFLINSADGVNWTAVGSCTTTTLPLNPDPCVLTKTKIKAPDGTIFYQFVVLSSQDDSWGFD